MQQVQVATRLNLILISIVVILLCSFLKPPSELLGFERNKIREQT